MDLTSKYMSEGIMIMVALHLGCFVPCLKRTKAKVLLKQDAAFYRVLTRKWSQTIDKYIIVHKKGRIGERNEGLVTRLNHELAAW